MTEIEIIEKALRESSKLYAAQEGSWRKCAEYIYKALNEHNNSDEAKYRKGLEAYHNA